MEPASTLYVRADNQATVHIIQKRAFQPGARVISDSLPGVVDRWRFPCTLCSGHPHLRFIWLRVTSAAGRFTPGRKDRRAAWGRRTLDSAEARTVAGNKARI